MTAKTFSQSPPSWIGLGAVILAIVLAVSGRFQPQLADDTASYADFDWTSLNRALSQVRTPGYPLFLRAANWLAPHHHAVPALQFACWVWAVYAFYRGLCAVGLRPRVAGAAALAMLPGQTLLTLVAYVMTDSLALSLAVATAGYFFQLLSTTPQRSTWFLFGMLVFLTYFIRPAYLFVIPLWPLLAVVFDHWLLRRELPLRQVLVRGSGFGMVTTTPFLAFCLLRLAVVGHFGLVSFGGFTVIGIAGQWIDRPMVQDLPADLRPFANRFLDLRQPLEARLPPQGYLEMERMYDVIVWQMAAPAAREIYGSDPAVLNRELNRLTHEIFRRRPAGYVHWLLANGKHAFSQVCRLTAEDRGVRLVCAVFLCLHFLQLIRRREKSALLPPQPVRRLESQILCWTAMGFAIAKILLVVLVEMAIDRYISAAIVFFPALWAVWAVQSLESQT